MNQLAIYEAISQAALTAADQGDTMPTTELGWLEFAVKNWGLAGVALCGFLFAMYRATQWAGRRFDRYLESTETLTKTTTEAIPKVLDTVSEIKSDLKQVIKTMSRVSGVVHRNCGRNEEPDSDTELGSGSGDIHDDGKHGRKSGERN